MLSPHLQEGGERIGIDGPRVQVAARAATSLALVLHELTTNAAKYGALSSPQGRVDIGWRLDGERMDLTWSERDGPAVAAAPTARGFGSLLTRSSVEGQLGGSPFTTGPGVGSGSWPASRSGTSCRNLRALRKPDASGSFARTL